MNNNHKIDRVKIHTQEPALIPSYILMQDRINNTLNFNFFIYILGFC